MPLGGLATPGAHTGAGASREEMGGGTGSGKGGGEGGGKGGGEGGGEGGRNRQGGGEGDGDIGCFMSSINMCGENRNF